MFASNETLRVVAATFAVLLQLERLSAQPEGPRPTDGVKQLTPETTSAPSDPTRVASSNSATLVQVESEPPVEVVVAGYLAPLGAGPRGATGSRLRLLPRQIPATVSVVNSDEIAGRAIPDVNQALMLVPGVTPLWEHGGFQFLTIRGFADYTVLDDGLRDDRNTFVTSAPVSGLWDIERIEVLKGPAGSLQGYGSFGVVNLVRKRPSETEAYHAEAGYGAPEQRRFSLSATGPIVDSLLYRLDAGTEFRRDYRGALTERTGGALALEYRLAPGHRLGSRLAASLDRYNLDAGLPTVNGTIPEGLSLDRRLNTPQDGMRYQRFTLQLDYEGDLGANFVLRDRAGVSYDAYRYFSAEVLRVGEDGDEVNREYFYLNRKWLPVNNQLEVSHRVPLGSGFSHQAVLGYDFSFMSSRHPRSAVWNIPVAPLPIDSEVVDPQAFVEVRRDAQDHMYQQAHGVFVQERLSSPWDFGLDFAARLDSWHRQRRRDIYDPNRQVVTERGETIRFDAFELTHRTALNYVPTAWSSTYVAYGTSFRPNEVLNEAGDSFEPQRGGQIEVGQYFTFDDLLEAHLAVYQIDKTNVLRPTSPETFDLAGKVRSRGAEVELELTPIRYLELRLGYAYTNAEFLDYQTSEVDYTGNVPRVVAPHSGTALLTSHVWRTLDVSMGTRWMGRSFADDGNTVALPGYGVMEGHVAYRFPHVALSMHARNLLDARRYFTSSVNGAQLTPGPGREVFARLSLDFQ